MLLEDEPEAASLPEPVDLGTQVGPQGFVMDLVQQDVQLTANHDVATARKGGFSSASL